MDGTPLAARSPLPPQISRLIAEHKREGPLQRDFYVAREVFEADLARIFHRHWLFAGYSFQIPRPGDFFIYRVGSESIIVVRDRQGAIRAFHNVCRHRGSQICKVETGTAHRLVCPYHRWTYELDGSLVHDTRHEFGKVVVRQVIEGDLRGRATNLLGRFEVPRIAARERRHAERQFVRRDRPRTANRRNFIERLVNRLSGGCGLDAHL